MASPRDATALWTRALGYLVLAGAGVFVVTYAVTALGRMSYPYELEWLEGGSVDHVRALLSGRPLYAEPSLEFTPFVYAPLYYVVCAGVAKMIGVGFVPLRLVSFLSSLGCFLIVFALVRRETNSRAAGAIAAGLLAASYKLNGTWFDVGRVDSLFLLLLLAGVYALRFGEGALSHVLAGVLVSLSIFTKQTALVLAVPLGVYCVAFGRGWLRMAFPATVALVVAAATLTLDAASGGWFRYYVFGLAWKHGLNLGQTYMFWVYEVAVPFTVALGLSVIAIGAMFREGKTRDGAFYLLLFAGMISASWFTRMRQGGFVNVLFPAHAVLSILLGMGVARLAPRMLGRPASESTDESERQAHGSALYETLIAFLCVLQFVGLVYDPRARTPTAADARAGDRLVETLRAVDGDVLIPHHGYLAALAGKATFVQAMPVEAMIELGDPGVFAAFQDSLATAIRGGRFAAIVLDAPWHIEDIERRYELRGPVFAEEEVFWPVTGVPTRPELLYVLRED